MVQRGEGTVAERIGQIYCGLNAEIYFQPVGVRMVFPMALKPKDLRNLYKQPLQPGSEIDLEINEESFNEGMRFIIKYGVDATQCRVTLAVHTAYFSDDFGWSKGAFIRRDPYNPNNWDAVHTWELGLPLSQLVWSTSMRRSAS